MGTRNLTMVRLDGELKVAQYGQFDGYLSGSGLKICDFLQKLLVTEHGIPLFKEQVRKLTWASKEEIRATWEAFGEMRNEMRPSTVADIHGKKYPEFNRDTGPKILYLILSGQVTKLENNEDFLKDSLFCEWAYEIDLDKETVSIYRGFQKIPTSEEYGPCAVIKEFSFAEYTEEAIAKLDVELS